MSDKHQKVLAVMDARDDACKVQLDQIGQSIGYGRAIQLLGQMWDDMMQASYPGMGRHQENMHRRSDIEKIEAGEPLARLVTYYRKLGPQGRHTRLMPMGEELENVRAIERDIALYGRNPTKEPTGNAEPEKLAAALKEALEVIDDYLGYEHNGDPWTEDARAMGEMDINDYGCDGRMESARALLAAIATTKPGT